MMIAKVTFLLRHKIKFITDGQLTIDNLRTKLIPTKITP